MIYMHMHAHMYTCRLIHWFISIHLFNFVKMLLENYKFVPELHPAAMYDMHVQLSKYIWFMRKGMSVKYFLEETFFFMVIDVRFIHHHLFSNAALIGINFHNFFALWCWIIHAIYKWCTISEQFYISLIAYRARILCILWNLFFVHSCLFHAWGNCRVNLCMVLFLLPFHSLCIGVIVSY